MSGWRIVLYYLSLYKRRVIFLSILGIISALANGVVPFIVGRLLDAILQPSQVLVGTQFEMPFWLGLLVAFGIVQVVANTADWIIDIQSRRIGSFLLGEYISQAVGRLLKLPLSFHKEERTGEVWDRIIRAMQAVTGIIERVVIPIAPVFLSIIVGLVIAFFIHPILAAVIV
ncbi:ABC transporter ATP-binding protein, partial [Candidatus Giovannonibacteria bacterium]|nr:ABC transporter ATP-binding protein [Candidatus Giovannonibacteria bacterium]